MSKSGRLTRSSFQLFDPEKRGAPLRVRKFTRLVPRIHFFEYDPRVVALFPAPRPVVELPPPADGLVNAAPLTRRLLALKAALNDLPRQARRLIRWQQRRKASPWPKSTMPLRPGHPPGHRRKPIHEVEEVLMECDGLAWEAMKPDTS
jgi:hypothetical protein